MGERIRALASGVLLPMLAGAASAQLGALDYSSNWLPLHTTPGAAFSGPGLFGVVAGDGHYAGLGDSVRRCYGVDSTQGGGNQSTGRYGTTWFKIVQGWAPKPMLQLPMSWDDLYGTLPLQAGSYQLGPQPTTREGLQTVPANFDGLTAILLTVSPLSLGGPVSGSDDFFLDGPVQDANGSHSQLWEGMFAPIISGTSTLSGGPLQIMGSATPSLGLIKLGIAAIGLQIDMSQGPHVLYTELGSALTVNLGM